MKNLDFDLIIELLRADGSIVVNKNLVQSIGLNEAVLYSELLSRYNYFKTRDLLDDEGYFYNTQYDLQAGTGLGEKAQRTTINRLKKLKLIEMKVKGLPARRHFKIIPNSELLATLMKNGKEKALSLANSSDTSIGGNLKRHRKELDVAEGSANNTHYNNTNLNNTKLYKGDSIEPRVGDEFSFQILSKQIDSIGNGLYPDGTVGNLSIDDMKEIIRLFIYTRWKKMDIEPSRLKNNQLEKILKALPFIGDEDFEPSLDDYRLIIDDYFSTDFSGCDYNINHFISGDVLLMRCYNLRNILGL